MTRQLDERVCDLWLDPASYLLRNGSEYVDRSSTAVAWEIGQPAAVQGWDLPGDERAPARAVLAAPYPVDSTRRWVRTPLLRADGMRSLVAVELFESKPTGTTTAYRTWDGTTLRYWTGSAWATATTDSHWSTKAQIEANLATHPVTARRIAFLCALATTDADVTPAFYGARVAYGTRKGSAERDMLATLRAALAALKAFGAVEWECQGNHHAQALNQTETSYIWTDADAVLHLDDEESAHTGTFVPGVDATWTPTAHDHLNGHILRFEGRYSLRVAIHNHRDVSAIQATPTVLLSLQGDPEIGPPDGYALIRATAADPVTARRYAGETRLSTTLGVRIIAELQDDLREIATALRAYLGPARYRSLVSQETGAVIDVREISAFRTGKEGLSAGVPESAATWRVSYSAGPLSVSTVVLSGAASFSLEEP